LTSRPDSVLSKCRRSRHPIPTQIATAPFGQLLDTLADTIDQSIGDYEAGYLLRINLFKSEADNTAIPGSELVTPIGLGREPIDALARYYHDTAREPPSTGLQDKSFFFWLVEEPETRRLYEMSEEMQNTLSGAGWDASMVERAIRQIGSVLQTSDLSSVAELLNKGVEFFVEDKSEVLSGRAAANRIQRAMGFPGALDFIYSEAAMIVRADVIGLGSGILWLGLSGQTAMQLVTVNSR